MLQRRRGFWSAKCGGWGGTRNAVDITIGAGAVEGEAAPQITSDPAAQTVTFAFPHPIAAGRHQLRLSFTGHINRFGRGLFVVDYPTAEGRKRMISP
jgi:hypothetical protein